MKRTVVFSFVMVLLAAGDARAQMTMSSFKGYLTGHVGGAVSGDVSAGAATFGLSVSVQEGSGWGAELDLAHGADVDAGTQELDVSTYMVNAAWVRPTGRLRPFGVGGVGVMHIDGCGPPCNRDAHTYDLGLTVGGGLHAVITDWAAVRGDARFIWSSAEHPDLGRPDGFKFWRLSAGFTFMWAVLP